MHTCNHEKLCQSCTFQLQQASKTTRLYKQLFLFIFKWTSSQSLTRGTDIISISCLRADFKVIFRVFSSFPASEGLHSKCPCRAEPEPGWTLIGSVFGFNELWASGPPTHTIHGQTCVKRPAWFSRDGACCTCWEKSCLLSWSFCKKLDGEK